MQEVVILWAKPRYIYDAIKYHEWVKLNFMYQQLGGSFENVLLKVVVFAIICTSLIPDR